MSLAIFTKDFSSMHLERQIRFEIDTILVSGFKEAGPSGV